MPSSKGKKKREGAVRLGGSGSYEEREAGRILCLSRDWRKPHLILVEEKGRGRSF